MKNRVRLMRTEEDVNENEGHFVSVKARLASLPRGCGRARISLVALSRWEGR